MKWYKVEKGYGWIMLNGEEGKQLIDYLASTKTYYTLVLNLWCDRIRQLLKRNRIALVFHLLHNKNIHNN